jgi:hypothetical protein
LLQTGYVEEASAVKINPRAVKIPEMLTEIFGQTWVMSNLISAVKMPKSRVRQKRILTEVPDAKQHPEFEAAQGNTVKIPEVGRRLSRHKGPETVRFQSGGSWVHVGPRSSAGLWAAGGRDGGNLTDSPRGAGRAAIGF